MRRFISQLAGKTANRPEDRRGQHPAKGCGKNAGLLLHRYLCDDKPGESNPEERRALLEAAINAAANPDVRKLYELAFRRWRETLSQNACILELGTRERSNRLIVGLGSENVLETGIRLHHTYGMPIIPGSALKGLAAHYCDRVWGARDASPPSDDALPFRGPRDYRGTDRKDEPPGAYYGLLFGKVEDSGCIVFHDAWYIPGSSSCPLVLDVMTPHHPGWNNLKNPIVPTDFDSPTPVPFLSVTGQFLIAVSWHGPPSAKAASWTSLALSLLQDALADWGVGGKTSSGYGRMIALDQLTGAPSGSEAEARRPRAAKASLPIRTITKDELKTRIEELGDGPLRLFKIEHCRSSGNCGASRFRVASKIALGYQSDGGWTVIGVPDGFAETFIVAECLANQKQAKFVEPFGRLASQGQEGKQNPRPRDQRRR